MAPVAGCEDQVVESADGLEERGDGGLKRTVGGVSQRMLSKTVRSLERDGLISRTAFPTVPVTVEHAITPMGETLAKTLDALRIWSADSIHEVVGARAVFDARGNAKHTRPR